MKKNVNLTIDILMYMIFIYQMLLGTVHNLTLHAILGIVLFCLFIAHHILNLWFYKSALKGKYNARRIVSSSADWILLVLMVLMAVSSVMMSGLVFDFSPIKASQFWRTMHLMSTGWGFMVMSLHVALHLEGRIRKTGKSLAGRKRTIYYAVLILIMLSGAFAFYKSQLYVYLFNTGGWKMAAANPFEGILQYLGITAFFCALMAIL